MAATEGSMQPPAMKPPYWAVIFTTQITGDTAGYAAMADRMLALAQQQPGYLGFESARDDLGITVSYWQDLPSIAAWKANAEHTLARQMGRDRWYRSYRLRIARVEVDYEFDRDAAAPDSS